MKIFACRRTQVWHCRVAASRYPPARVFLMSVRSREHQGEAAHTKVSRRSMHSSVRIHSVVGDDGSGSGGYGDGMAEQKGRQWAAQEGR